MATGTDFIPGESVELLWSLLRYLGKKGSGALIEQEDSAGVKARRSEGWLILHRGFSPNVD